jgi:hypothetical protein
MACRHICWSDVEVAHPDRTTTEVCLTELAADRVHKKLQIVSSAKTSSAPPAIWKPFCRPSW